MKKNYSLKTTQEQPLLNRSLGSLKQNKQNQDKKDKASHTPFTRVYVLGSSELLGFAGKDPVIKVPKLCSYNILIRQIACGPRHTHILTQDGYVYSMGFNTFGVLGLNQSPQNLNYAAQPQLIQGLYCINSIATGDSHTLVIDITKTVFAWGNSANGAIGVRSPQGTCKPQELPVQGLQIVKIACGEDHSCFLSEDNQLFSCGLGDSGQLGIGYQTTREFKPLPMKGVLPSKDDTVSSISCGPQQTIILTKQKKVYVCGESSNGQLGITSSQLNQVSLQNELSELKLVQIACGQTSYGLSSLGVLYVWGSHQKLTPNVFVEDQKFKSFCSFDQGFSAAIDLNNSMWAWSTQTDQICQIVQKKPSLVKMLKKRTVRHIFAGKSSLFALGEDIVTLDSNTSQLKSHLTAQSCLHRRSRSSRGSIQKTCKKSNENDYVSQTDTVVLQAIGNKQNQPSSKFIINRLSSMDKRSNSINTQSQSSKRPSSSMSRKIKTFKDGSKNKLNFNQKQKHDHQNIKPPTPTKTPKRQQLTRMYSKIKIPQDQNLELNNLKQENAELRKQLDQKCQQFDQSEKDLIKARDVEVNRNSTIRQLEWQLQQSVLQFKRLEEKLNTQSSQFTDLRHDQRDFSDNINLQLQHAEYKVRRQEELIKELTTDNQFLSNNLQTLQENYQAVFRQNQNLNDENCYLNSRVAEIQCKLERKIFLTERNSHKIERQQNIPEGSIIKKKEIIPFHLNQIASSHNHCSLIHKGQQCEIAPKMLSAETQYSGQFHTRSTSHDCKHISICNSVDARQKSKSPSQEPISNNFIDTNKAPSTCLSSIQKLGQSQVNLNDISPHTTVIQQYIPQNNDTTSSRQVSRLRSHDEVKNQSLAKRANIAALVQKAKDLEQRFIQKSEAPFQDQSFLCKQPLPISTQLSQSQTMNSCAISPLTVTRENSIKAVKQVLGSQRVPVHQNISKTMNVEQSENQKNIEEKYEMYNQQMFNKILDLSSKVRTNCQSKSSLKSPQLKTDITVETVKANANRKVQIQRCSSMKTEDTDNILNTTLKVKRDEFRSRLMNLNIK